ncbi:MAG TPA: LCP family protein [Nocardioides sp.]|jgi:LCP family protein required for cell wall assembly|uniref:LCP family protein n=1 Tax=Nocardioides sp. TaxID=35761 RepID=UPI002E2FB80E|nr:LCP family protein [Nocardioides sp.]HEX3931830.1 LCP family protein [Nocardioides sp.]
MRRRVLRVAKLASLGVVLAVVTLVLPDASPKTTEFALVKVDQGSAAALGPDVISILAVGSDARPGEDFTRTRGDALQLVTINTRTHAASIIGVPRDSWVDIPGHGIDKINASLYYGGPQLMGDTVGNLIGVHPDYVFVTRFQWLTQMVNWLGGIDIRNPFAFSDEYLKPKGFRAGRIHLDGYDALAYSRIRHSLPTGDFERSAHQEIVLKAIQAKVRANADKPGFVEHGVLDAMSHMDTNLSPSQLFRLAQVMAQVDPSKVRSCVVQGGIGTSSGGASIVLPYVSQARDMGNQIRHDATLSHCG